ncbi:uncharacterized protein [Typha latifolia]|uniref:uncharacterized protein n=1 Tax=Typha latifolia TaxID=4733 RepID=UPI003C2E99C5
MVLHYPIPLAHSPWLLLRTAKKSAPVRRRDRIETRARRESGVFCLARRRVRYEDEEEGKEEYGFNTEIAMLESYSESARNEAFLVQATVDSEEEMVLIFKGFSSCLRSRTASDPSRSVLPARAMIKSIDVIKGPFDPNNIEYLEQGLAWEAFRSRLQVNNNKS